VTEGRARVPGGVHASPGPHAERARQAGVRGLPRRLEISARDIGAPRRLGEQAHEQVVRADEHEDRVDLRVLREELQPASRARQMRDPGPIAATDRLLAARIDASISEPSAGDPKQRPP
jgi:hypothetical protein